MNFVSPGTGVNLPVFQYSLACSIRSLREDTKFQARALQCGAAEKHHSRDVYCPDRDAVTRMKDQKPRSLESLAFTQAQRNDFTCQTVDCVVTALERLAVADVPVGARLSPDDLAALYVSEDQRQVHDAATRQFAIVAGRNGTRSRSREEPGG